MRESRHYPSDTDQGHPGSNTHSVTPHGWKSPTDTAVAGYYHGFVGEGRFLPDRTVEYRVYRVI